MKTTFQNIILILATVGLSISLRAQGDAPTQFNEMTIAQLQALMAAGRLTSVELTQFYLERIFLLDQNGTGRWSKFRYRAESGRVRDGATGR